MASSFSSEHCPLTMARTLASSASNASQPWIFLSHSGQQKRSFVTPLYHALLHANHLPFFDQDDIHSLPAGREYPPEILQACRACKMGVIVLSEGFVQSLWPMLELQLLLTLPSASSDRLIYPLFYQLGPADLTDPANLKRWKEGWEANSTRWQERVLQLQQSMPSSGWNLDISSWADNLAKLKDRNGTEKAPYQSDYDYIQKVVSTICARLPPPQKYSLDGGIKGVERMQQVIADAFIKQEASTGSNWSRVIGVHGIGGSGKSTLCKTMVNFFSKEFPGRCFYLEFPSNQNEVSKLVPSITRILTTLSCLHQHESVSDIDEALSLLKTGLQRNEVFLAIDNIWEPCFGYASTILMSMSKCMQRSKVLVTGRSKELVTRLLQSRVDESMQHSVPPYSRPHDVVVLAVPSLTEAEAMEALKWYSHFIPEDCLRSLASSCFFQGQCHPLFLNLMGAELRKRGRFRFNHQKWQDLILELQFVGADGRHDDKIEQAILQAVGKSLDECPPYVQDVFIDMATCELLTHNYFHVDNLIMLLRVLRFDNFTENAIRCQVLNVLEFHGLVELESSRCEIHDLHKQLAKSRVLPSAISYGLGAADNLNYEDLSVVSTKKVMSSKYVRGHCVKASTLKTMFQPYRSVGKLARLLLRRQSGQIRYLLLTQRYEMPEKDSSLKCWPRCLHLGGGNMKALRALILTGIEKVKEIKGWEGVPNLMWLKLDHLVGLTRIGPINGGLTKLEWLMVRGCAFNLIGDMIVGAVDDDRTRALVKVGDRFPKLQVLDLPGCYNMVEVGSAFCDAFPVLKKLNLSDCGMLRSFPDLEAFGSELQSLDLSCCSQLLRMEGSICSLTSLEVLNLNGCLSLENLPDMSNVVSLKDLSVVGGCLWRFISNFTYGQQLDHPLVTGYLHPRNAHHESSEHHHGQQAPVEQYSYHDNQCYYNGRPVAVSDIVGHGNIPLSVDFNSFTYLRSLHIIGSRLSKISIHFWNFNSLPSLEKLILRCFGSVRQLSFSSCLVNIRELYFDQFDSLEEICGFGAHNTCLSMISIERCPLLVSVQGLDAIPCLDKIQLSASDRLTQNHLTAGIPGLSFPHGLRRLEISRCESLRTLIYPPLPGALQELTVNDCHSLRDVSSLSTLKCLVELSLVSCSSLWVLNLWEAECANDVTAIDCTLPSLRRLSVNNCSSLMDVSSVTALTSLQELEIVDCTKLKAFPDLRHLIGLRCLHFVGSVNEENLQQLVSATTFVHYAFHFVPASCPHHAHADLGESRPLRSDAENNRESRL